MNAADQVRAINWYLRRHPLRMRFTAGMAAYAPKVTTSNPTPDGSWVINVTLATGEDPDVWTDRISDLCRCRRHWWQFWRVGQHCFFDVISGHWEADDEEAS